MNYLKSNVEASVMKELPKKDKDVAEIQENMFDLKIYQELMIRVCSS